MQYIFCNDIKSMSLFKTSNLDCYNYNLTYCVHGKHFPISNQGKSNNRCVFGCNSGILKQINLFGDLESDILRGGLFNENASKT